VLWRLRQPIVIDGDVAKAVEIERYNRWLAVTYGGDMTTDVSRILRLPGTINFPNERKRARGLVPVLSRLVLYDDERLYDLQAFQATEGRGGAVFPANTDSDWQSIELEAIDEIEIEALPPRLREIIENGRVEGGTLPGDDSGSGWAFHLALWLTRIGWPVGKVAGTLLQSAWLLGKDESVHVERQARRTAWRAMNVAASCSEESRLRFEAEQLNSTLEPESLDFSVPLEPEPLDFTMNNEDGRKRDDQP
jgi:hypothetical protein